MIEAVVQKGLDFMLDIRVVREPAGLGPQVHIALDRDRDPKAAAMRGDAVRPLRRSTGSLEGELFY